MKSRKVKVVTHLTSPLPRSKEWAKRLYIWFKRKEKKIATRNSSDIYNFWFISLVHALFKFSALHHACLKSIPFLYFSRDHLRVDNGDHLWSILGIICGTVQLYTCSTHGRVSLSHAPFFPTPTTSKRLLRRVPTCSRGSSRNARLEIELKLNIILPANFLPFTS